MSIFIVSALDWDNRSLSHAVFGGKDLAATGWDSETLMSSGIHRDASGIQRGTLEGELDEPHISCGILNVGQEIIRPLSDQSFARSEFRASPNGNDCRWRSMKKLTS